MVCSHFFRVEISGGHTGSAYAFHSGVFATLDAAAAGLCRELSRQPLFGFAFEAATFQLSLVEDGVTVGVWDLYPALSYLFPRGERLSFAPVSRWCMKCEVTDGEGVATSIIVDSVAGDIYDFPVVAALLQEQDLEARVDFSPLGLPSPRGNPLPAGQVATYVRAGQAISQHVGWFSDWDAPSFAPDSATYGVGWRLPLPGQ